MNRLVPPVLCLLAACHCTEPTANPGAASKPVQPEPTTVPTPLWQGPAVECSLETMESQPPQFAVNVKVTAPSGGYELVHDRNEAVAGGTRVLLTLTGPGPDEAATMALEDKQLRIPLGTDPGGLCLVCIRQQARNTHYLTPPEYQLARALPVAAKK